jgi:hypothetical protein
MSGTDGPVPVSSAPRTMGAPAAAMDLEFVDRYVELWNEPDAQVRRRTIEELWAPGGANYTASKGWVGYDALEARVSSAYEAYVSGGKYLFRTHLPPVGHHGTVKVTFEMVSIPDGEVASIGIEFLVLDERGRISSDHQFIVR